MKYKHLFTSTLLAILITSCNYLDIVPDNIATLEWHSTLGLMLKNI